MLAKPFFFGQFSSSLVSVMTFSLHKSVTGFFGICCNWVLQLVASLGLASMIQALTTKFQAKHSAQIYFCSRKS
jgi:hypothetical protein